MRSRSASERRAAEFGRHGLGLDQAVDELNEAFADAAATGLIELVRLADRHLHQAGDDVGQAVAIAGQRQRRRQAGERVVAEGRARHLQDQLVDIAEVLQGIAAHRVIDDRRLRAEIDGDLLLLEAAAA